MQNGIIIITLTNLFIVDHDLIRFTQYIHVHYTSLRETRPTSFILNLHQGLLQTFLTYIF